MKRNEDIELFRNSSTLGEHSGQQVESQGRVVQFVGVKRGAYGWPPDIPDNDAFSHGRPFAVIQAKFNDQFSTGGKGARNGQLHLKTGGGNIHHPDQAGIRCPVFSQQGKPTRQIDPFAVLTAIFQPATEAVAATAGAGDRDFLAERCVLAHIRGLGLAALRATEGSCIAAGYENGLIAHLRNAPGL